MKEQILKSVAQPPLLFYAPFLPAVLNITLQFVLMIFMFIITGSGKAVFLIITIVLVHMILILLGKKEPHLSSIITSLSQTPKRTKNIINENSNKFTP